MPETVLPDRVELNRQIPEQSMIPDGFAMNAYLRGALPKRYREAAVDSLSWVRQSAGVWFPRWYPTPTNYAYTIAAYDTYAQQHRITPGALIWGWNLAMITGTITNLFIQVVDPCSRHALFQFFASGNSFRNPTYANRRPGLLLSPYQVQAQGLIDVQIRNNSSSAVQVQFVLHCAEPGTPATGMSQPQSGGAVAGTPTVTLAGTGSFHRR